MIKDIIKYIVDLVFKGLVGFDFVGDEFFYLIDSLVDFIQEVKCLGYLMILYVGECGCVKYIVDSLNLGIKCMGYVIVLIGQRDLIK